MRIIDRIRYNFGWMKIYFSPFKFFWPELYIGKIAVGTPYFLPRRWKKYKGKVLIKEAKKRVADEPYDFALDGSAFKVKDYEHWLRELKHYSYAIPKRIGFDFVSLGWKTKWSEHDFRHEWNPIWSFVFFKWQIALAFIPEHCTHYWECWLTYRNTDKKLSTCERLTEAMEKNNCVWQITKNGKTVKINYWEKILKNKYQVLIKNIKDA